MWVSRYVFLFMIYSFMGWVYETMFCTIKGGKWENRGFLYGPGCPIYGIGAVTISVIMQLTVGNGIALRAWQVFLISVLGSAVLEYTTSWVLEKMFHAAWWDYSDWPLNLHGRICLFASLGFGVGGLLTVYVIAPFTVNAVNYIQQIVLEFLALLFLFVFAVDLTLTVTILLHFDLLVAQIDDSFNQRMETIVDATVQQSSRIKKTIIRTGQTVNERIDALSRFTKGTVRRIYSFRDRDEQKNSVKNNILSMIRNAARRNRQENDIDAL